MEQALDDTGKLKPWVIETCRVRNPVVTRLEFGITSPVLYSYRDSVYIQGCIYIPESSYSRILRIILWLLRLIVP